MGGIISRRRLSFFCLWERKLGCAPPPFARKGKRKWVFTMQMGKKKTRGSFLLASGWMRAPLCVFSLFPQIKQWVRCTRVCQTFGTETHFLDCFFFREDRFPSSQLLSASGSTWSRAFYFDKDGHLKKKQKCTPKHGQVQCFVGNRRRLFVHMTPNLFFGKYRTRCFHLLWFKKAKKAFKDLPTPARRFLSAPLYRV